MSSQEAPTENHNAHESPERRASSIDSTSERAGGEAKERFEDEQSESSKASEATAVDAEDIGRREPDWGDRRRHRPSQGDRHDFREGGREWGPTAALSGPGTTATSYGDERRRGRRDPSQSEPTGTHRQPDRSRTRTASTGADKSGQPRAVEFEPVRRWGAVERVRTARLRPVRPQSDDDFEAVDRFGTPRTNGAGVEDGPARERERAGYRYTSEIEGYRPRFDGNATEQTGQGHSTF